MKIVREIITKIVKNNNKIMLGRWRIDYNEEKLERIVKLANEDNCGVCQNIENTKYDYIYILDDINVGNIKSNQ